MITRERMDRRADQLAQRQLRAKMVFDFGDAIQTRTPGIFHDVDSLPHAKIEILAGILNAVANSESRFELETYSKAAFALAYYQTSIGDKPLTPFDVGSRDPQEFTGEEFLAYIRLWNGKRQQIESLISEHTDDLNFIRHLVEKATALNPYVRPAYKRVWEKFRRHGVYSPFSDGFVDAAGELLSI